MSPLSEALRRLANQDRDSSAVVSRQTPIEPQPATQPLAVAFAPLSPYSVLPVETAPEEPAIVKKKQACGGGGGCTNCLKKMVAQSPKRPPVVTPHLLDPPAGTVQLICDLTNDHELAFRTAAKSCDLVIQLLGAGESVTPGLKLFDKPLQEASRIHWPGDHSPSFLPGVPGVPRVQLQVDQQGIRLREWVLFLDDCRTAYNTTGLLASPHAGAELDWLATRCDGVCTLARNANMGHDMARKVTTRLTHAASVPPMSLMADVA